MGMAGNGDVLLLRLCQDVGSWLEVRKPLCPDGGRAGTQWGESVFGSAATYPAAALSTRAQLGLAAVTGALLATDYEAYRNHAWSDVKGKARGPALRRSGVYCASI